MRPDGNGHQIRKHYGNWSMSLFTSGQTALSPNTGGSSGGSVWLKADAMAVTGELMITPVHIIMGIEYVR